MNSKSNYVIETYPCNARLAADGTLVSTQDERYPGLAYSQVMMRVATKSDVMIAEGIGADEVEALADLTAQVWMFTCGCGREIIEQRTTSDPDPMCCECHLKASPAKPNAVQRAEVKARVRSTDRARSNEQHLSGKAISFEMAERLLNMVKAS